MEAPWKREIIFVGHRSGGQADLQQACERLCKVVKLGSKNWITNGSFDGARSSALMYSLIETAKLYGLNARNYLAYVFMKGAASHNWEIPAEELEPLMPWNVKEEDLSIVTDEIDWFPRP